MCKQMCCSVDFLQLVLLITIITTLIYFMPPRHQAILIGVGTNESSHFQGIIIKVRKQGQSACVWLTLITDVRKELHELY